MIFGSCKPSPRNVDRQIGGLGLGLYICRQIVDQHGGRIWASSRGGGAGTTMHVWLPRG